MRVLLIGLVAWGCSGSAGPSTSSGPPPKSASEALGPICKPSAYVICPDPTTPVGCWYGVTQAALDIATGGPSSCYVPPESDGTVLCCTLVGQ